MTKAYQYYKDLPGWAKGVVIVGGAVVVTVAGFKIYKIVTNTIDREKEKKAVDQSNSELKDLKSSGTVPTYSDSQYTGWADKIQSQFDGCDFEWDKFGVGGVTIVSAIFGNLSNSGKTLYAILNQFKNDADFLSLVKAYGVRTYDQCGWFMGDFTGNLYKAVSDELDTGEIKSINELLASKGITYKF